MRTNVGFSTLEVAKAVGISPRRVAYAAAARLIVPSVFDKAGTGNHRRFSIPDTLAFAAVAAMRDHGVSLQALRLVQRYLSSRLGSEFKNIHRRLVYAPGSGRYQYDIALLTDDEYESLLALPGQRIPVVAIDAGGLFEEVRARLEKIRTERKTEAPQKRKQRVEHKRERSAPDQRLERVA